MPFDISLLNDSFNQRREKQRLDEEKIARMKAGHQPTLEQEFNRPASKEDIIAQNKQTAAQYIASRQAQPEISSQGEAPSSIGSGALAALSSGGPSESVGGSVAEGAAAGSVGGPWGAAIGAGVGLLKGIIGKKAKDEERRRQSLMAQGQIAQETGIQVNNALSNIMASFRAALS